jgi:6-phosphogluconolactonase
MASPVMKTIALILISAQCAGAAVHSFFIGTRSDRGSKGIYVADFDDRSGALSNLRVGAEYRNPGFLCLHPGKKILYAVGARADGTESLAAFGIGENQSLTFLADVPCRGTSPCHLAVDPSQRMIAVANYSDGCIASFLLDPKGIPGEAACVVKNEGKSIHPQRQTAPHAHGVYFSGDLLFVPDLGLDQTLAFTYDAATAKFAAAEPAFTKSTPGDGPRHLAFHPVKPWVYVVNELANTVTHFSREKNTLTAHASLTTLPAGYNQPSTTAEIEVHANGKFLYASNRGHNSIAAFRINQETGALTEIGQTTAEIKTPRHFAIAPGGAFLIVAGQDSDNLQVLSIDPQSGALTATEQKLAVPAPTCLLFARP